MFNIDINLSSYTQSEDKSYESTHNIEFYLKTSK